MKSKIELSRYSMILTVIVSLIFIVCLVAICEKTVFFILLSLYIILLALGLLYGPAYIKATPDKITMGSILKSKNILMRDVLSVDRFSPTMGAIRIFGSGGFMGYWGIFKEGDIGRYYAFYGKASDCFLVRVKNGDKYVLGCKNPAAMIDYINSQINK